MNCTMTTLFIGVITTIATTSAAQGTQGTQVLHSSNLQTGGQFGRGVGVSGDTLAIGSNQLAGSPLESGKLSIYRRSASGAWVLSQEFGRNPHFTATSYWSSSRFANGVTIVGDSMMVESEAGRHCFEFRRGLDDLWHPYESIEAPEYPGVVLSGATDSAYDGETLVMGFGAAGNLPNQLDPNIFFFEQLAGTWFMVRRFTAIELGLTAPGSSRLLGRHVAVQGDFAAVSTPNSWTNGIESVGLVATFRRVAGQWQFDRFLQRPGVPTQGHWFGHSLAMDEDWLFVGCLRDVGRVSCIYVYRNDPLQGWQLDSRIFANVGPPNLATFLGFSNNMVWVPPTLAVAAPAHRVPVQPGNPDVGGRGVVFLLERCDGGVWNQRVGMHAPLVMGSWEMCHLHDTLDFDGETLVGGTPYAFEFNWEAGMAAVAPAPVRTTTACDEIGRPVCTPATPDTTDCPCGAVALPGRGCPNAYGPGARLYAHGAFNEATIRRVLIEDLPPHSLVLLHVADGIPSVLPAGQVAGDGILCVTPTVARRVGLSNSAGQVIFDHVQVRPPLNYLPPSMAGYQQPIQAVYRSPLPGPCNARWNATNALQFLLSTLGPPL